MLNNDASNLVLCSRERSDTHILSESQIGSDFIDAFSARRFSNNIEPKLDRWYIKELLAGEPVLQSIALEEVSKLPQYGIAYIDYVFALSASDICDEKRWPYVRPAVDAIKLLEKQYHELPEDNEMKRKIIARFFNRIEHEIVDIAAAATYAIKRLACAGHLIEKDLRKIDSLLESPPNTVVPAFANHLKFSVEKARALLAAA